MRNEKVLEEFRERNSRQGKFSTNINLFRIRQRGLMAGPEVRVLPFSYRVIGSLTSPPELTVM